MLRRDERGNILYSYNVQPNQAPTMMEAADKLEELAGRLAMWERQDNPQHLLMPEHVTAQALMVIVGELRRLITIVPAVCETDEERRLRGPFRPRKPSTTGPEWAKSDRSMYPRWREDGWPLCPDCGQDSLCGQVREGHPEDKEFVKAHEGDPSIAMISGCYEPGCGWKPLQSGR